MILIIYHNDLDGWTAAKIIEEQEKKKEKVRLLPFNYGDEVPDIANYSRIYVLDLSLNAFPNLPIENVIHIDHHSGPLSSKTVLCKSSVTKFCWEWFNNIPNIHVDAIDDFDNYGPFGHSLDYGLRASQLENWMVLEILRSRKPAFNLIKREGRVIRSYLEDEENLKLRTSTWAILPKEDPIPLLQGPIHTLKQPYIAFQIKISTVDFKIQHKNAFNIAIYYGGSGHGNVGDFTKPLKEGLTLLQNWL
jgi:hypothetical protein